MNISSVQDLKKQQQQQKHGKWNSSSIGESSNLQSKTSYYVKLAPESPNNKSLEVYHDESSYDSFHNWETDVCKDSEDDDFSDSGSSKTEGYAVLDLEYEVASTSDDDDTGSSVSSGTDEFAIEAATTAFYEFNALVNGQLHDEEDDDDEFILADTEDDSDGSIDLELGQADYLLILRFLL